MSYDENEPEDYDGYADYVTGRAPGLDGKTYVDGVDLGEIVDPCTLIGFVRPQARYLRADQEYPVPGLVGIWGTAWSFDDA